MTHRRVIGAAVCVLALASCGGGERKLVGYTNEPAPQVDAVALPDSEPGR